MDVKTSLHFILIKSFFPKFKNSTELFQTMDILYLLPITIVMSMKIIVRLMSDYCSSGLWAEGGMIEYSSLNLSENLSKRIYDWVGTYEGWLDWSYPGNSPEPPLEEQEDFDKEGIKIWKQLIAELGDDYEVVYFGEKPNLDRHNFTSFDEYLEYCSILGKNNQNNIGQL